MESITSHSGSDFGTDLWLCRSHWSGADCRRAGDTNFDGTVDMAGLGSLGANWSVSQVTGYTSALVPEPTTLSLLAMSVLVVGRRRR